MEAKELLGEQETESPLPGHATDNASRHQNSIMSLPAPNRRWVSLLIQWDPPQDMTLISYNLTWR